MKEYSALIVDLKKSRSYTRNDRYELQEYIFSVIEALNSIFNGSIEKHVDFSAGDEIQGLFSSSEAAYLYLRMFNMLISPVEIRAGIGVGTWDVVIKNARTTAQDGQAYHNARYAIEQTKESNGYSVLLYSNRKTDFIVNSLINSTMLIIEKHSEYQNELMLLSELLYPIDAHGIIGTFKIGKILDLLHFKNHINYYKNHFFKKRHSTKPYLFETLDRFKFETCAIDALNASDTFFVTSGKKRGLSIELSRFIGVSRQSIEKTIKTANIYEARNATVSTLKFMSMF